ncbi:MAG: hypothetical protein ACRYGP_23590 [Janthinobacterium lividum]
MATYSKSKKRNAHFPSLPPKWAAFERACGPQLWQPLTPLVREAIAKGIDPCGVDEALVQATLAAARARGVVYPDNIAIYARLAWNRVAEALPELGLVPLEKPGRPAPRRHQWQSLEPELRDEITAFIAGLGRAQSANVAVKNKLLRALEAADEKDVEIGTLDELFGERGIAAVLGHKRFFGVEGRQHESRSDVLELARIHARMTGDVERYLSLQDLIDDKATLPTTRSPVSPGDLLAVDVLLKNGVSERLVTHTVEVVDAFVAKPTRDRLIHAQVGLLIRLTISLSLLRKIAVNLAFEGPERRTAFGLRPTLVSVEHGMTSIEASVSAGTVDLLDRFFMAHRLAFGAPVVLYAHADGSPKTAATLSEAVRRFGRVLDLELSPTILRTYTIARLVKHMRANGGNVDVTRLKDHLDIGQAINFNSRFGALLKSDVFEQVAHSALGS